MTVILLIAFWLIGWFLTSFEKRHDRRIVLALPFSFGATAVVLETLWWLGWSFDLLATIWWCFAVLAWYFFLLWLRKREVRLPINRKKISGTWGLSVQFRDWPLLLITAMVLFSAGIVSVWSWTVRPVTWDNLSLYEGRAHLLAEGKSFGEFQREFTYTPDAIRYDFLHPFSHSLVSALFLWSGSEWTAVWPWTVFLSTLVLAYFRLSDKRAFVLFCLLLLGTRFSFEQAIESYASWVSGLHWLLAAMLWPEKKNESFLWPALFAGFAVAWRSAEPYWMVFIVVCFLFRRWLPALFTLGSLVLWRLVTIRSGEWFPVTFAGSVAGEAFYANAILLRALQFPLLGFIFIFVFLFSLYRKKAQFLQKNLVLLVILMLFLFSSLFGILLLPYRSTLGWKEISSAWQRVALVPGLWLIWFAAKLAREE